MRPSPMQSWSSGRDRSPACGLGLPLGGSRIIEDLDFRARWDLNAAIADYLAVERTGSYGAEAIPRTRPALGVPAPAAAGRGRGMNHSLTWRQRLSFGYIGAIYVWAAIIVVFAIATPHQFLETYTIRAVVNNYSITGLAALAVLVPMAAGTFDASIGGNISLSGVICAYLLIHTGLSIPEVVLLSLASGLALGLVNVLVVVVLGIPSLIGTLATWLIADSLSVAISDNATLSSPRISGAFSRYLSNANWSGFDDPHRVRPRHRRDHGHHPVADGERALHLRRRLQPDGVEAGRDPRQGDSVRSAPVLRTGRGDRRRCPGRARLIGDPGDRGLVPAAGVCCRLRGCHAVLDEAIQRDRHRHRRVHARHG